MDNLDLIEVFGTLEANNISERILDKDDVDYLHEIGLTNYSIGDKMLVHLLDDEKSNMLEEIYAAENPLKLNERGISELHDVLQETAARLMIDKLSM